MLFAQVKQQIILYQVETVVIHCLVFAVHGIVKTSNFPKKKNNLTQLPRIEVQKS